MNEVGRRGRGEERQEELGPAAVRGEAARLAPQLRFIAQGHGGRNQPCTAHLSASDGTDASHPDGS